MSTLKEKLVPYLAIALVVLGAGVANAGYFDNVAASYDRVMVEPARQYNFGPALASFDRAFSEEKAADSGMLARRSYERMLGEGVFVKKADKFSGYEIALAGWEDTISKRELCDTVSPVLLDCNTK